MKLIGGLVVILFIIESLPAFSQNDERILSYKADYTLDSTGTLFVKENIRVHATGQRIQHGIFRSLPQIFERDGEEVRANIAFGEIKVDGFVSPYDEERKTREVQIKIGNADVPLERGVHEFEINYSVQYPVRHYSDADELYWNVTSYSWEFEIDTVVATIRVPTSATLQQENLRAFSGTEDSKTCLCSFSMQGSNEAIFKTLSALASREGFAIKITLPPGVIEQHEMPSADGRSEARARGAFSLAVLVVILFLVRWRYAANRQIRQGGNFSAFTLSPAATRFVQTMRYDRTCFAAALVSLHAKKAVAIEKLETGPLDFSITQNQTNVTELTKDEAFLLKNLFEKNSIIYLPIKNVGPVSAAMDLHKRALQQLIEGIYFDKKSGLDKLTIVIALSLLVYSLLPFSGIAIFLALFLVPFVTAGIAIFRIMQSSKNSGNQIAAGLAATLFLTVVSYIIYTMVDPFFVVVEVGMVFSCTLMLGKFANYSKAGKDVLQQIETFKRKVKDAIAYSKVDESDLSRLSLLTPYVLAVGLQEDFNGLVAAVQRKADETGINYTAETFLAVSTLESSLHRSGGESGDSSDSSSSSDSGSSDSGSSGGDGGGGGGGW